MVPNSRDVLASQTIIQWIQPKILRIISNASRYVSNQIFHEDLRVPYVTEAVKEKSIRYYNITTRRRLKNTDQLT